ncbi:hypothetical protein BV22DRAFT_228410 [Leucogyrophana mollusca]|uniref:Uncharacterized protein n=1 Tax=Leucogyrophana mollusca TaxID=85980 RepID=A0ACB8BTA9_9AGAM|nr:hypothetical protein BV22DRAFT_228410 [Leucogyrophana mollusca]
MSSRSMSIFASTKRAALFLSRSDRGKTRRHRLVCRCNLLASCIPTCTDTALSLSRCLDVCFSTDRRYLIDLSDEQAHSWGA